MSLILNTKDDFGLPEEIFRAIVHLYMSPRPVRSVTTRGDKRARGIFPSLKIAQENPLRHNRYQSLVEQDLLRLVEVAGRARRCRTHPYVLQLSNEPGDRGYTPDAEVCIGHGFWVVEAKGDYWLTQPASLLRLRVLRRRIKAVGLPWLLVTETDLRPAGLQEELAWLLRVRPSVSRLRVDIDPGSWDPLGREPADAQTMRRWRDAQRQCDELLERVMRRDPDEILSPH